MIFLNPEIYLDMDGVVADWHGSHSLLKNEPATEDWWEEQDEDFYNNLDVLEGAKEFYEFCKNLESRAKISKVRFLTGTILTAGCTEGKLKWIERFTEEGKWGRSRVIMCDSRDKQLIAKPHRILIDDKEVNVKAWIDNGGIGIHHINNNFVHTKMMVERYLKTFF